MRTLGHARDQDKRRRFFCTQVQEKSASDLMKTSGLTTVVRPAKGRFDPGNENQLLAPRLSMDVRKV